jgi:hypothetical protein
VLDVEDGHCASLFALTGGNVSDTIGACLAIAHNPGLNAAALYNIAPVFAPFQPTLSAAPKAWTVSLTYSSLPLSSPGGLAFDSQSNLWISDASAGELTELYSGSDGTHLPGTYAQYTGGGLLGSHGLAIDFSDNIWVANTVGSSVVEFDAFGNLLSGPQGYSAGGINAPVAIAIDGQGGAWIANYNGNTVTELLPAGTASSFSPISTGALNIAVSRPTSISTDLYSNVYVSNSGLNTAGYGLRGLLLRFDLNGNPQSCLSSNMAQPLGMAVDVNGNYLVASSGLSGVTIGGNSCSATNGGTYAAGLYNGGGIQQPSAVALDGRGNIWIANSANGTNGTLGGSISSLSAADGSALSPAGGYGQLNRPLSLAVDNAGSVWTADAGGSSVTEFVGIASPRMTPIAAATYNPLAGK